MRIIFPLLLTLGLQIGTPLLPAAKDNVDEQEIIHRFAAKETEFRSVWQQYTYTQRILFQVLGWDNNPREQRELIVEVFFTSEGRRETRTVSDRGRLRSVGVTREDISDATSMQPFVLTTEELPNYKIDYKGVEHVDELDTYVFKVKPRKVKKGKRYFEGKIWVDQLDLQIVMTKGKIVPDYRNNKFPEFETVREQIEGSYWFPTWTEADDILEFGGLGMRQNRVHVRILITYGNFQKYEVGTSIKYGTPSTEKENNP